MVARLKLATPLVKLSVRLLLPGRAAGTLSAGLTTLGAVHVELTSLRQNLRLRLPLKSVATPQLPVLGSRLISETCRSWARPATATLVPLILLLRSSAKTKALLL